MTKKLLAVSLFFALAYSPPLQASDVVSRFLGVWVGEGLVRPHGFDPQVVVRCRIKGTKMNATQINFAGRCATPSGSGAFNLMIAQDPSGRVFSAKGKFAQVVDWVDFSGTGNKNAVVLKQKKPISQGNFRWMSEITLTFQSDGVILFYNNLSDKKSGKQTLSFSVSFHRRD